jgi:hypothetical protein
MLDNHGFYAARFQQSITCITLLGLGRQPAYRNPASCAQDRHSGQYDERGREIIAAVIKAFVNTDHASDDHHDRRQKAYQDQCSIHRAPMRARENW